jgi:dihydroflavonol-4-reductase
MEGLAGLDISSKTGNIADSNSVERAIEGHEIVVHAAHNKNRNRNAAVDPETEGINLQGTRNVISACEKYGVRRLLQVSSVAAIGIPENSTPADETFEFNLKNSVLEYHRSKRRSEELVLTAASSGLDAVVVNPASIFGPFGSRYRGMELLQRVRTATILPYFSGGICVVHVADVVDGIVAAAKRGISGNRYILGGENISYRDMFQRAAQAVDAHPRMLPVSPVVSRLAAFLLEPYGRLRKKTPRVTYATHYFAHRCHYYDSNKARRELSYSPRSFQSILDECVSFAQTPAQSGARVCETRTA